MSRFSVVVLPLGRSVRCGCVRSGLGVSVPADDVTARRRVPAAARRRADRRRAQARLDVSLPVRGPRPGDRRRKEPERGGRRSRVGQGLVQPGRGGRLHPRSGVHGRRRSRI